MMTISTAGRAWLISATLAGCVSAGASRAEEGVAIKNLLGDMGIVAKEKDPIRYRERAPLVLPPKMDLREPAQESFASANPQWPKDPDVVARKRRQEANAVPVADSETRRMSERNARLSIDEMRSGRSANAEIGVPGTHRGDNARDRLILSPDEMRSKAKSDDDDVKTADGTPMRRTLTDPPSTLRKPTGAPERLDRSFRGDQQAYDANPLNWIKQQFSRGGDDD